MLYPWPTFPFGIIFVGCIVHLWSFQIAANFPKIKEKSTLRGLISRSSCYLRVSCIWCKEEAKPLCVCMWWLPSIQYICWKDHSFLCCIFLISSPKKKISRCMGLFLNCQFLSMGRFLYLCSIVPLWLLEHQSGGEFNFVFFFLESVWLMNWKISLPVSAQNKQVGIRHGNVSDTYASQGVLSSAVGVSGWGLWMPSFHSVVSLTEFCASGCLKWALIGFLSVLQYFLHIRPSHLQIQIELLLPLLNYILFYNFFSWYWGLNSGSLVC